MTRRWRAAALTAAAAVWVAAAGGCGESVRISPEEEGIACVSLADCEAAATACRTAVGCEGSRCVFEDVPEGTTVVCYGGAAGTEGKGICQAGLQQCDGAGNPVGGCVGEVVPEVEGCPGPLDEDCDGLVNEEGESCTCGDGIVSAGLGETCDDGNADSTDLCTATCEPAACGDGFVQVAAAEICDDGGTSDGDRCSPTCQAQEVLGMAASGHTCAVLSHGAVKCWGRNEWGQLGLGDPFDRGANPGDMGDSLPAVDLGSGQGAVALAVSSHTCALLSDGSVKCWGLNDYGQLGLGDTENRGDGPGEMCDNLPAVSLGTGRTAVGLVAGWGHGCARLDDGSAKCWGVMSAANSASATT